MAWLAAYATAAGADTAWQNLCTCHPMTRYLVKIEQFRENYWGAISQEEDNACTY